MSLKILLIDDEPDAIEFQKSFLTRRNYVVFTARNTDEAINIIKERAPDIIFCDIRLETDTAGLDILAQAKKIKPDIIVYLVTGLLDKDIRESGIALGAKEVLIKPASNEDLEKKIKEASS
jgi:CheY-like chemotaxis protein